MTPEEEHGCCLSILSLCEEEGGTEEERRGRDVLPLKVHLVESAEAANHIIIFTMKTVFHGQSLLQSTAVLLVMTASHLIR